MTAAIVHSAQWRARGSACVLACAALGWHGAAMWWVSLAVHTDGDSRLLRQAAAVLVVVATQLAWWLACWLPLRRALVGSAPRLAIDRAIRAGLAWCLAFAAADTLRQLGWWGDGYASLGVAMIDAPGAHALYPLVGAQGVGVITMTLAASVFIAWTCASREATRGRLALAFVPVLSVLALVGAAGAADRDWTSPVRSRLTVLAIQPDIDKRLAWNDESSTQALEVLSSEMAAAQPGSVIITPETYLPWAPPSQEIGAWGELHRLAAQRGLHALIGMPHMAQDDEGLQLMNAVVQIAPQRQSLYAKERLVPGAEYLPWPGGLGPLYQHIFFGAQRGESPAPPELTRSLFAGGASIGVSICHEQSFAYTMAERARDSSLLVNVSDDSWIASRAYRAQMLATARIRAMEFGRPLLRVTNGGVSALVGSRGDVLASAEGLGAQRLRLSIEPREGRTPYQRVYAWIAAAPLLACLAVIALARARRARPPVQTLERVTP